MKKHKVLHYVVGFSTLSETFIYDLITGLESRGHTENIIVCRKRTLENERPFKRVIVLKQKKPFKKLFYKVTDPKHFQLQEADNFERVLQDFKPDIIHAHFGTSGIRINNFLEKYKKTTPLLVSFHGSDVTTNPFDCNKYMANLLKINNRKQNFMTVPTSFLKNACKEVGLNTDKIFIRNNTINDSFLGHDSIVSWNKSEKLKIVILGRLVPMKGHRYAIEAMSLLENHFSNYELHIWGDGRSKEELLKLTDELDLNEKVKFKGAFSHQDLPKILSEYHISITPSIKTHDNREESFCISLVEASLMGLFCIASRAGGPNEVLKDNEYFKFETKNSEAIRDKVLEYIKKTDESVDKAKQLKEFMLETYHPDKYFLGYLDIYNRITK